MKTLAAFLALFLLATGPVSGDAVFYSRDDLIAKSDAIIIADLEEPVDAEVRSGGAGGWTYRQQAKGRVVEVIRGEVPEEFILHGGESFECAQCDLRKGRHIAFLRKAGGLWVGTNWNLSLRPISDGKVEWYSASGSTWEFSHQPVEQVLAEIRGIVKAGSGSARERLASGSQEIRDQAALELLKSHQEIPREKWDEVVARIQKGQTKNGVLEILAPFQVQESFGAAGGGAYSCSYRLDDEWMLRCDFERTGDVLFKREIFRDPVSVWVKPPADFTGKWKVYFVNGRCSHEINYKDGKYSGEFIAYRPDGSRCYVQHYGANGADGPDTGYYPSGKVMYEGVYKNSRQSGVWKHYDENGNVTSSVEHPE